MVREATVCVSIGALGHLSCPEWFDRAGPRRWEIPDTHHVGSQGFREIRDAIRSKVEALLAELRENEPRG